MAGSPLVILSEEYGKKAGNEKHQFAPGVMLFCVRSLPYYYLQGLVANFSA